jgi:RNA helicase HrpA
MQINYNDLPVYQQKQRILDVLDKNQVVVVQSPTGSGKTTQIPVILHEAGFSNTGIIAVTQPRRIAALSVSEFIAKQLGTTYPGLVGYKMRFEDKTDQTTKIKIMTDGILLQEMKLDPWLSKYSVIMVDEAHERSLNIDFVLGLLKRVLAERHDFKVIVSSATMNAEAFSAYFDDCPIVTIDTITYPVTVIYDPPVIPTSTQSLAAEDALLSKIESTMDRILDNKQTGDILVFLPGEKVIKNCMQRLSHSSFSRKIHLIPLYGRLAKEEQERVFDAAPFNKKKVIISTNIAETSVTIPGITTVIDSGLAKLNYYNPRTYTSSLNETAVSKASCNQRKGRAGRTQEGTCYRLYSRKDYDTRPLYTLEEIYRTDLSEVVLRMAELGITDFESFHFISPPGKEGLIGGIETLKMLKALNPDHTLSQIGKLMVEFPLMPRQSRIIVEAILTYPDVLEEVLIAAAFLSTQSPFVLPPGEETDARIAHNAFRDMQGDFVSYVKLFRTYTSMKNQEQFCEKNYLDQRVMAEIYNVKTQLEQIVSDLGIPISNGGKMDDYLTCIASGMIQFVCIREGKENYRSLTAEHIQIHPGSSMFRSDPLYIVAGEIVRTSRMFAMSVSPLTRSILMRLDDNMESQLSQMRGRRQDRSGIDKISNQNLTSNKASGRKKEEKIENSISFGGHFFEIEKIKGKKIVLLPWEHFKEALKNEKPDMNSSKMQQISGLRGKIIIQKYELLSGDKMDLILKLGTELDLTPMNENAWSRKAKYQSAANKEKLIQSLDWILRVAVAKEKSKEMGFICLFTDGNENYWYKVSRGFSTALNESISSLENLIDEASEIFTEEQKNKINSIYRKLTDLYVN